MGFGLLFVGYFIVTLMSLIRFGSVVKVIGYLLIGFSAWKLKKYNRNFQFPIIASGIMLLISGILAYSDISGWLFSEMLISSGVMSEAVRTGFVYAEMVFSLFFNSALLFAIYSIAKETGLITIATRAVRNFVFILLYYVLNLISYLPFSFVESYTKYFGLPVLLLYFAWIILNLMLIFSCYMKICDENDADMARKPSRFAFVNRMREEQERKSEAARQRDELYRKEKMQKKKTGREKTKK